MPREDKFDIAVIGSGPAGIMAALTASKNGSKVILLEKNNEIAKKLLLTGGGRCNITNAEFDLRELVKNYNKGGKFLFHAFSVFGPKETIEFLNNIGIKTKIEGNKRVFPVRESAKEVRNVLEHCLAKNKVVVSLNSEVKKIIFKGSQITGLALNDKEITAKKYIFCTGGKSYAVTGSDGLGYELLKSLGHTATNLSPSLSPIKAKEEWVKELQGLSLRGVQISVLQAGKKKASEIGDIIFTHFGLSGPAVLDISRNVNELLQNGEVKISIDLIPSLNFIQLEKKINEDFYKNPKKYLKNYLEEFMAQRMVPVFAKIFDIKLDIQLNNVSKKERTNLVKSLKNLEITAEGILGFDMAMVTSGGISLDEIDDKTMKSKIIKNLFLAGEIIDVDARTGGFNLQASWTTGYLAGKSAI